MGDVLQLAGTPIHSMRFLGRARMKPDRILIEPDPDLAKQRFADVIAASVGHVLV